MIQEIVENNFLSELGGREWEERTESVCVLCVCIVQKSCGQPESACESVSVGENSRKR